MKKLLTVAALLLCVISMTGCIGTAPYGGCKTPLMAHFKVPVPEYYKPVPKNVQIKHGESTHAAYMSLISVGGLSVKDAADDAGIKNITSVEYEYHNAGLFLYQQITMHVYGY
jgi:TRL-like protein family